MAAAARDSRLQQKKAEEDLMQVEKASATLKEVEDKLKACEAVVASLENLATEARCSAALQEKIMELETTAYDTALL